MSTEGIVVVVDIGWCCCRQKVLLLLLLSEGVFGVL